MVNNIREIITKAIIAKGKKSSRNKYTFEIAGLTKVLGCWVTNHVCKASFNDGKPEVNGSYDVHIWYHFNQGTNSNIYKTKIEYVESMDINTVEERVFTNHDTIEAQCDELPKCIKVDIHNQGVTIDMEKEILVRIIGETCIRVETKEESDEIWDSLEDFKVNENFIT